jgi:hypothetical protein
MGVDKEYGSGKPRSAANSRARQRVAAGNFTKGPKPTTRALKKIAAQNPVTGFIGGGVLASRGFARAAVGAGQAVVRRTKINTVRLAVSGKAQNMPIVDVKTGTSPFLSEAIQGARRDLVATAGRGKTYTGMRSIAASIGRQMEKDHRVVENTMDKFGPNSAQATNAAINWHNMRSYAVSLKQEAKKALATKRTAK